MHFSFLGLLPLTSEGEWASCPHSRVEVSGPFQQRGAKTTCQNSPAYQRVNKPAVQRTHSSVFSFSRHCQRDSHKLLTGKSLGKMCELWFLLNYSTMLHLSEGQLLSQKAKCLLSCECYFLLKKLRVFCVQYMKVTWRDGEKELIFRHLYSYQQKRGETKRTEREWAADVSKTVTEMLFCLQNSCFLRSQYEDTHLTEHLHPLQHWPALSCCADPAESLDVLCGCTVTLGRLKQWMRWHRQQY